jgi:hypothetical protein
MSDEIRYVRETRAQRERRQMLEREHVAAARVAAGVGLLCRLECAALLSVSPRCFDLMVRDGRFPAPDASGVLGSNRPRWRALTVRRALDGLTKGRRAS